MPVNKPHIHDPGIYFITFTNYKWLPLIQTVNGYDLIYKWFDHLVNNGHEIAGYVIMPNHLHVLIGFNKPRQSLNTIIGNGKRFIAYEIIERLKHDGHADILTLLAAGVNLSDKARGKLHEVFQPSFDIKECNNLFFLNQKLKYMHNNPLAGKWTLSPDAISYAHSSARFYETGSHGIYPVTNVIDIVDKEWI